MNSKQDARVKLISISRTQIMHLITGDYKIKNIPEYTKILEVRDDFITRCFDMIIEHPSFPPVKEGRELERFELEIEENKNNNGKRKLYFD